jgi:hypothetical protein
VSFVVSKRSTLGLRDAAEFERRGDAARCFWRSRGDDRLSARRENFACLLSLHASRCVPRPTWRRLHQPFTGYAVEFHDEQPGYRLGKLRGLFADTAW